MAIDREEILKQGRKTIGIEAEAVGKLSGRLDDSFVKAVEILFDCSGRVIITGVGKSGLIGQKLAATFSSTGTPATFLHSAEAVHGDLGILCKGDVVIAISHSGETDEIRMLIPIIKRLGLPLIAMTGQSGSVLSKESDVSLDISVREEACPLGLAPTASTAATLAMGDALAVALLKIRGFREEDFAMIHPGGKLGRKWLRVEDLMHSGDSLPCVTEDTILKDAIYEISSKGLGVTLIIDGGGKLTGIITDGDLRRMIEANVDFYGTRVVDVMTRNPKRIGRDVLCAKSVQVMESHSITSLAVTDEKGRPIGVIHLHDLLKKGVV